MNKQPRVFLKDILDSIEEIESYFVAKPKTYNRFIEETVLRRAIERNLEIIGEALNGLIKIEPNIPISDKRKIIASRNKIIHGYDSVNPEQIWRMVVVGIPVLKKEVEELLEKGKEQDRGIGINL